MNKVLIIQAIQKEIDAQKDALEKEGAARIAIEESYMILMQEHAALKFKQAVLLRMAYGTRSEKFHIINKDIMNIGKNFQIINFPLTLPKFLGSPCGQTSFNQINNYSY